MLCGPTSLVFKDWSSSGDANPSEALCHLDSIHENCNSLSANVSKQKVCERTRGILNSGLNLSGKVYRKGKVADGIRILKRFRRDWIPVETTLSGK